MKLLPRFFVLILAALAMTAFTMSKVTAQETTRLYPVKFICGKADGRILAAGNYTTAINIQNPNHNPNSPPVQVQKRISVALPGENIGGTTDFIEAKELPPGDAYEIDCPEIFELVREFCSDGFCKGFVTLRASAELEVVSVYSAADQETEGVEALHTDRVTTAENCPIVTATVPSQTMLFVPPHVRGDREFDGHGPCIRFSYDLRVQDEGTTLLGSYFMHAYECSAFNAPQSDFTAAEGSRSTMLFSAGPGSRIRSYGVTNGQDESYRDTNHSDEFIAYPGNSPLLSLQFTGDTGGDESGTETGVQIVTREFQITLEDCGAPLKDDG